MPIVKFHFLKSFNLTTDATINETYPSGQSVCDVDSSVLPTTCAYIDTPPYNEYEAGEWETVVLSPVDDIYSESPTVTISKSDTVPGGSGSSGPFLTFTWNPSTCLQDVEVGEVTLNASFPDTAITGQYQFKCFAEFQGDSLWHFYIRANGVNTSPVIRDYSVFPARKIIPYSFPFTVFGSGNISGTTECVDISQGFAIDGTVQSHSFDGIMNAEWARVPSGYIEFDWT